MNLNLRIELRIGSLGKEFATVCDNGKWYKSEPSVIIPSNFSLQFQVFDLDHKYPNVVYLWISKLQGKFLPSIAITAKNKRILDTGLTSRQVYVDQKYDTYFTQR